MGCERGQGRVKDMEVAGKQQAHCVPLGPKDPPKEGVMVRIKSKEDVKELSSVLGSSVVSIENKGILT